MRVLTDWLLTPERVALHLPSATAVVADLHLGYDQARQRGGEAVPSGSLEVQLLPLHRVLARHRTHRLVIAGDLFEDRRAVAILPDFRAWLNKRAIDLVGIIPGNHDAGLRSQTPVRERESGSTNLEYPLFENGLRLGDWRAVHGDGRLPRGRLVHGHEHPWVQWTDQVGAPCYLVAKTRLILPAYSADAAGVNILGLRRWQSYRCCVIAGERVLDFGLVAGMRPWSGR